MWHTVETPEWAFSQTLIDTKIVYRILNTTTKWEFGVFDESFKWNHKNGHHTLTFDKSIWMYLNIRPAGSWSTHFLWTGCGKQTNKQTNIHTNIHTCIHTIQKKKKGEKTNTCDPYCKRTPTALITLRANSGYPGPSLPAKEIKGKSYTFRGGNCQNSVISLWKRGLL